MKKLNTLSLSLLLLVASIFVGCEGDIQGNAITPVDSSNGTNSSYARMITVGNYLYAININELVTFDASVPSDPTEINRQEVGEGVETLFHIDGTLLIGSSQGTFTFTIESTGIPTRRGQFDYNTLNIPAERCDPVIASGNVAYATLYTLRPGEGACGRDQVVNLLVVMDITDLENPTLITTVETASPRGLAIDGDHLFVCNDTQGFTIFDVSDPSDPTILNFIPDVESYDVVAKDGRLIVVGGSQLVQFDYTEIENLVRLSAINI